MSKELPQQQPSEEVDIGQLFKLIGNAFNRLFSFIGSIFNKLFLTFIWLVFFVKKHFVKLVAAGVIGIILGLVKGNVQENVYKSHITIKQNYNTGENLYNTISYYNDLVKNKDYAVLEEVLGLEPEVALSVSGFEIESILSENERIKEYDAYIKKLDSVVASTVTYDVFLRNDKDYNHKIQEITIKSKTRKSFKIVFDNIVENIKSNPYFKREQEKDLNELSNRENSIKEALTRSDSLQNTYKRVLENNLSTKEKAEIGITFEGNRDGDKTKEFDLYKNDLELREELVLISREKADKQHIIEVLSSKQDSGSIDNKIEVFGLRVGQKLFFGLLFSLGTFIVLLSLKGLKYLENFKDKVE